MDKPSTSEQALALPRSGGKAKVVPTESNEFLNPEQASAADHSYPASNAGESNQAQPSIAGCTQEKTQSPAYVDASGFGVGFFYEGQWQAWEFVKNWKEPGIRDIQWAEAVGLELGLRLMIKAGYLGKDLVFCSDNTEVVRLVSNGLTDNRQCGQIVQQIQTLCQENDIRLSVDWTPGGSSNPADAPSRLSADMERFPHDIDIPGHLQMFVHPFSEI